MSGSRGNPSIPDGNACMVAPHCFLAPASWNGQQEERLEGRYNKDALASLGSGNRSFNKPLAE
jgi:hypothetical protein